MSALQQGINKFVDHFRAMIELIQSLPEEKECSVLRKALYVAVIDSVGSIIFPSYGRKNALRFRRTINEFAEWQHATYYSLPYIYQYLKCRDDSFFEKLAQNLVNPAYGPYLDTVTSRVTLPWVMTRDHHYVFSLRDDLSEKSVALHLPPGHRKKREQLTKFQHCNLLYTYRNILVHTLSLPGMVQRPEIGIYPYYEEIGIHDFQTGKEENYKEETYHELIYTSEFLRNLCMRVVANSADRMLKEEIDPYPRMQSFIGIFWDDELNQTLGELGQKVLDITRSQQR